MCSQQGDRCWWPNNGLYPEQYKNGQGKNKNVTCLLSSFLLYMFFLLYSLSRPSPPTFPSSLNVPYLYPLPCLFLVTILSPCTSSFFQHLDITKPHRTGRFITVFTTAFKLSQSFVKSIQYAPSNPTYHPF